MPTSELSFEDLFDAAPDGMLLVDESGRILVANERARELFGYDPGELEDEFVETLVPDDVERDHEALRDQYFDAPARRPMGAGIDLRARRKDGSTFPVDIGLSPVDDGRRVIAAVRDVSEQRALRRTYRAILATIPDALVVADSESGEIVEVNEQATRLFGRDRGDLVGSHVTSLHPAGKEAQYARLFERHVDADGAVFSTFSDGEDIMIETADERLVPVEINARNAHLDDHPVTIGVFRDVSERRASERDLQRQLERVESLTQILSHDLRGPLNVAQGYLELASETGETERTLEKVADAHERMETIVEDVLTMLQETAEPNREPVDVRTVARESWAAVTGPDGTLVVEDDARLAADPRQVRHLFENLFRNAVTHAGDDVRVGVGLLGIETGFYVEDDGPGIPEPRRDAVTDSGVSTRDEGVGLGLVIVSQIATAHDWDLSITESATGGARFEFRGVDVLETGPTEATNPET